MFPYIDIHIIQIPVFPLVVLGAILICLYFLQKDSKINQRFIGLYFQAFVVALCSSLVGGKITFAISLAISGEKSGVYGLLDGFAYYGALIGGYIGLDVFSRSTNHDGLSISDVIVTYLPLGQTIGRVGCYCNGCCYGKVHEGVLSVPYLVQGELIRVYPTWFIEAIYCFIIHFYLRNYTKQFDRGYRVSMYLVLYGTCRFFVEFLRGDYIRGYIGVISLPQYMSIIAVIAGVLLYLKRCKLGRNEYLKETL